jgi:hypothetical protein
MDEFKPWIETHQDLPSKYQNSTNGPVSGDPRGAIYTSSMWGSKTYPQADQGAYFTAKNATPLTGIAGITAADGLDDLEALIFLRNATAATKRIYLDFILLDVITGVGTNGTNFNVAMKTDSGASRYASGGTAIVPTNTNQASSVTSEYNQLYFGAVVPTAATSSARLVHHVRLRTVIKVLGDKYLFTFGQSSPTSFSGIPLEGTLQASIQVPCPPVILGAGDTFLLHEFASSQTVAATYQFTMGWFER